MTSPYKARAHLLNFGSINLPSSGSAPSSLLSPLLLRVTVALVYKTYMCMYTPSAQSPSVTLHCLIRRRACVTASYSPWERGLQSRLVSTSSRAAPEQGERECGFCVCCFLLGSAPARVAVRTPLQSPPVLASGLWPHLRRLRASHSHVWLSATYSFIRIPSPQLVHSFLTVAATVAATTVLVLDRNIGEAFSCMVATVRDYVDQSRPGLASKWKSLQVIAAG